MKHIVIYKALEFRDKDWNCTDKDWPALVAQSVECPLRGTGGHGFDPGSGRTKMVLAAPRLALRLTGIEAWYVSEAAL